MEGFQVFASLGEAQEILKEEFEPFPRGLPARVKDGLDDEYRECRFEWLGHGTLPSGSHVAVMKIKGGKRVMLLPSSKVIPLSCRL
jgi:hypothetical protein